MKHSAETLQQIKAIPVKSPMSMVYRSGSVEADKILKELGLEQPDRILVGALPKQSWSFNKTRKQMV